MRQTVDNVNQPAEAAGAEADVLELVHAVMHQYRSLQYQALRDGAHGVTHMDSKVLGFFSRHPGATQSELAQHSGRDKAQLARLVAGLRERGLLEGAADDSDRRSLRLSLTEQGRAVQRALKQQARRITQRATAGLSAADRTTLLALLTRVKSNLEAL
jgi:DNA-binding MarR family transcriptional regulator